MAKQPKSQKDGSYRIDPEVIELPVTGSNLNEIDQLKRAWGPHIVHMTEPEYYINHYRAIITIYLRNIFLLYGNDYTNTPKGVFSTS